MPVTPNKVQRLYLRVSADGFSFAVYHPFGGRPPVVENYDANLTASLNVNLREALNVIPLAQEKYSSTEVLLNVPYTLVPLERFEEEYLEEIYRFNFHAAGKDRIFYDVVGALGVVVVYGLDEAFCRVVDENFNNVHFRSSISAMANRFAEESSASRRQQMFAYRHESFTDIFAFRSGRLQLGNRYVTKTVDDAAYYVILASKMLDFNVKSDEYNVIDTVGDKGLVERLHDFIQEVHPIESVVSGGKPFVGVKDLPFDLMVYLMQPY